MCACAAIIFSHLVRRYRTGSSRTHAHFFCSILYLMRNVRISLPANAAMLVVALDVDVVFLLTIYLLSTGVVDVCCCFCATAGLNCELALGLQCLLERAHELALGLCPLAGLCVRFSLLPAVNGFAYLSVFPSGACILSPGGSFSYAAVCYLGLIRGGCVKCVEYTP